MPKQSKMSSSGAQNGIDNIDPSLENLLKDISSLETIVDTWDEQIQNTVNALKEELMIFTKKLLRASFGD